MSKRRFQKSKDVGVGIDCPRCGEVTRRMEWPDFRLQAQHTKRVAYRWWFLCTNPACATRQIMPKEARWEPEHSFMPPRK